MAETRSIEHFLTEVKTTVDARLADYITSKRAEAERISKDSAELVDGVAAITLRGGKRFRPIVLSAAYRAVNAEGSLDDTIAAGVALELLQSFLLIHDDWMDQDEERRGGPAVHVIYRNGYADRHIADSLGILAGDLASTYAWELMLDAPFPATRREQGLRRFVELQKEVYLGQHLDVTANADVARMHDLKTGSYTVRGPLLLGAILGDASAQAMDALVAYGDPLGRAFQLRDDLLGTFGDKATTGKPAGNDIRAGKRNSLMDAFERRVPEAERGAYTKAFGRAHASDVQIAAAAELLVESGARAEVEQKLSTLRDAAVAKLDVPHFNPEGRALLTGIADMLVVRSA